MAGWHSDDEAKMLKNLGFITCVVALLPFGALAQVSGSNSSGVSSSAASVAYFVSASGNDLNNGLSQDKPFATLSKAQVAMRGTAIKATYVMDGTYTIAGINLGASDSGEKWLALPGHKPVINGGGTGYGFLLNAVSNITISGFTFTNAQWGVYSLNCGCSNLTYTHNTAYGISATAFQIEGTATASFTWNTVYNVRGQGINVGNNTSANSNITVAYNDIHDVNQDGGNDRGCIYVIDRLHAQTNVSVSYNTVYNCGASANSQINGIYLDDNASNVTVKGNLVYGTMNWGIQLHGGDHIALSDNIWIADYFSSGIYLWGSDATLESGYGYFGMTNNTIFHDYIWQTCSLPSPWPKWYQTFGVSDYAFAVLKSTPYPSSDNVTWANLQVTPSGSRDQSGYLGPGTNQHVVSNCNRPLYGAVSW